MIAKSYRALLFLLLLSYSGYAISCDTHTKENASGEATALTEEKASTEEDTSTKEAASTEEDTSAEETDSTEDDTSTEEAASTGDIAAGEERYKKSCVNCHGAAGKGVASYPKISGKEISYTKSMLETYRDGIKVGPNSSLMIMMAKPLTDEEIANLAAYLKDAIP